MKRVVIPGEVEVIEAINKGKEELPVVVDRSIDYEDLPVRHGQIRHSQQPCSDNLSTIPITPGQTMTFLIPGKQCVNLARSYVEFNLVLPTAAGANNYYWLMSGCIAMFKNVGWGPSGTEWNLDAFHHFSKLSLPYCKSILEIKSYDNSQLLFPSRVLASQNKLPANGFNASVPFDEMQYAINLTAAVNSTVSYSIKLPLSLFVGTPLANDRSMYYGSDTQIIFTMEDNVKWLWTGTDPVDPSIGAAAIPGPTAAGCGLVNPHLQLAVEVDPKIKAELLMHYERGFSVYVDVAYKLTQQVLTGTSQQLNPLQIKGAQGSFLKRIYSAPFAQNENLNTSLDHCNNSASPAVSVANNRVITYQSSFDSEYLQQQKIYASPQIQGLATYNIAVNGDGADFYRNREWYEGSLIYTSGTLGLNFAIIDDFTEKSDRAAKNIQRDHVVDGRDIRDAVGHSYFIDMTNANGSTNNWYCFGHYMKKMNISATGGLTFVPEVIRQFSV